MNKAQKSLVNSLNKTRTLYSSGGGAVLLAKLIKMRNRVVYACDIGISAQIAPDCVSSQWIRRSYRRLCNNW